MGKKAKYKSKEKEEEQAQNEDKQQSKEKKIKKKAKSKDEVDKHKQQPIKQQQQQHWGKARKSKKSKKKKKKKGDGQVKEQQQKQQKQQSSTILQQQPLQKGKISQAKKGKKERQLLQEDKMQAIDVQSIKFQQQIPQSSKSCPSKIIRKKEVVSFQDSQQIIYLFSLDAGDYKGLRNQLPHVGQRNIRNHLKVLFEYCLDKITERVKDSGRKIKQWENYERREIIRELHRIRSSNRLLSEANAQLRQTFHKMMSTYNHPEIIMTDQQITFLFRKIQAFVRGFNQLNFFRKNHYVAPDQEDQKRKPIIEGGYIMQQKIKRQHKKTRQKAKPKLAKIDPQKLVLQWSEDQQKELCKLYLYNLNCEFIIENLRAKFGESDKWKDFQILGKKIDHIIKLSLSRLQELTVKPYIKAQRIMEDERREKREEDKKRTSLQKVSKFGPVQIDDLKEVVYSSREVKQSRLIKNPSLLLKQVFAHQGESQKVKHALVKLLAQKYPQESQLENTLQTIKVFTEWAARQEETNHVTLIRSREPVIDDGTKSRTFTLAQTDSERSTDSLLKRQYENDEAEIAMGLTLLEDGQGQNSDDFKEQTVIQNKRKTVYFGKEKFDFDSKGNISSKSKGSQQVGKVQLHKKAEIKNQQRVIQVYQSEQSEYQGFISKPNNKKQQ